MKKNVEYVNKILSFALVRILSKNISSTQINSFVKVVYDDESLAVGYSPSAGLQIIKSTIMDGIDDGEFMVLHDDMLH